MTSKEHFLNHLERAAYSHGELAATHRKIAKSHGLLAKAFKDDGESVIAQHHDDLSHHHNLAGDHHDARQADYETLREHWANASGADVIDSHEDSTRDMHGTRNYVDEAARAAFGKSILGDE